MAFSEQGDEDSFVVELLNARERHGDGKLPRRSVDPKHADSLMAAPPGGETAAKDGFLAWDAGAEYEDRARGNRGVGVSDTLEAGLNAKQLLRFVSNFRTDQGNKLGLLDEQDLKFATSQVLRKGPRAGADAVCTQFAGNRRSRRVPTSGASPLGFAAEEKADEVTRRAVDRQPLEPRKGASQNLHQHGPPRGREGGAGPSTRSESARRARGRSSASPDSGRPVGEDDGVETARLCDELLRWSSALEGAERQLGGKGGPARMRSRTGGNGARTPRQADGAIEEGTEQSTPAREDADLEGFRRDKGGGTHHDTPKDSGRSRSRRGEPQRDDETGSCHQGGAESNGGIYRSLSLEDTDGMEEAEEDWEESERGPTSSPWRRQGVGARGSVTTVGHDRPTPSYALPTKHFKTLDRDRRHVLYAEDAHGGQKKMQRQTHLEEVNAALRLRMEGQRRAIHELEHQANTLREDARIRQEELSRLKKRVATTSSTAGGKCSCCASTHHVRVRAVGDNGATALKKRALTAEGRTQTLERCLSESKAKEQRSREIVASLKHSYSGAQAKVVDLEAELESTRNTLSEARHELAESRRNAKGRMKDTRRQRRQQGEKERETEIARAEVADLAVQLKKASREVERARREAVEMREDRARVEGELKDLERENRMLQDRLNAGDLRSRVRERDRWILAELRSESASPHRRGPPKASPTAVATRRQPIPSEKLRTRVRNDSGRPKRLGVQDASLDSTSGSDSSARCRSPSAGLCGGAGGRPPRRDGRRVESEAPAAWSRVGRTISTRSADGAAEGLLGDAAILRGSTLSGGSLPSSAMGARYERLQAMYQRVNRRDAGTRGRAGSVPGTDTRRRGEPCIAETLCRRSGSYQVVSCCAWFVSAPPALLVRSQGREKVQYFLMRDEKHERHAVWLLKPVHACLDLCLSEYAQLRATVVRLYVTHARKFFMLNHNCRLEIESWHFVCSSRHTR